MLKWPNQFTWKPPRLPTRLRAYINVRTTLVAAGVFCCLAYATLYALPKHVTFSYAGETCAGQLTLFPAYERAAKTSAYLLSYSHGYKVGGVTLMTTRICFAPKNPPQPGNITVASAPFGSLAFRSTYQLVVTTPPHVLDTAKRTQALNAPLALKLSQADRIYHYSLLMGSTAQACTAKDSELLCGVDKLGLVQGVSYDLKLQRSFGTQAAGEPTAIPVAILPAAKVVASSLAPGATVYTKPKSVDITLDHPLTTADATLTMADGDKNAAVAAHVKVDGTHVLVSWDNDLARERNYQLTLKAATATDGSMLDTPYVIGFATSGGPKVTGVNIGGGGVAADSVVVVSFDQPLAADTNVANFAHIAGGAATISRQGSSQIAFALHGLPRCGAFTVSVAKGLVGENGVVSTQDWGQDSRINCRATRTIGYSVNGRPIVAYYYGSGATTILFTGGIHGDEPSGVYIMQDWANYLDTNGYKIPAGKQVVIVPNANPDGIATSHRYNANNVNLDRNFTTSDWISDIALTNGQIYPRGGGVTPMSEPETQALAALTSSLHPRVEISFHSQGATVGANKVADSVAIGSIYASGAGYSTMFYNPETIMGYTLTGEYETWMGEALGIPAILIELPTHYGRYFSRHVSTLWSMVNL